ncbi:hypothetical protein FGO68_gene8231 [Halteria grandinella]|uniref:Uncharacterized protein n=1 Tax=Halteria grandinella TaxID=5974 RepID=A0A8J8NWG7_HALGN|nr:hypothetical protein FGO68_gene8231 [Halteria grandinella]
MGFKSKLQLVAYLPNLSVTDLTKLGLPEAEATIIMRYYNKTMPKTITNSIFSRLASKYINLEIVGYALIRPEAIDLGYLCHSSRLFLIRNYQLLKKIVINAEKKIIKNVFELLDERFLSKKYRLYYEYDSDNDKDIIDCLDLLGDRIHLHSVAIKQSLLPIFSKFRPFKMRIWDCQNIPYLLLHLPSSVIQLTLANRDCSIEGECGGIRKFMKLKLSQKYMLDVLSRFATATQTLTIQSECLEWPGVIEYLAQMDCKQVIVETFKLFNGKIRKFFNCQSNAKKFIENNIRNNYSQIGKVEWAFKYFTQKCLDKEFYIRLDKSIDDVKEFYERIFNGYLQLFQNKRIQSWDSINGNFCVPNADTHTQRLSTNNIHIAVLALNNCAGLTQLEIYGHGDCAYEELIVQKLSLQELIIEYDGESISFLIQDILNKSKDTLQVLKCGNRDNLSPLKNSQQLKNLRINGKFKGPIDAANLEVIATFYNLEELETKDERIVRLFNQSQTLKTLIFTGIRVDHVKNLPESVTKVVLGQRGSFNEIKAFLEQNPFVKEINIQTHNIVAASLLEKFKHIKFTFSFLTFTQRTNKFFTFKQCYGYMHPEYKEIAIPGTKQDHVLCELLYQMLDDKRMLFGPYLEEEYYRCKVLDHPDWMDCLQSYNEFHKWLRTDKVEASYFDRVFTKQICKSTHDKYLRIIVSAYNAAFQLGANIDRAVIMLKGMTLEQRENFNRESFFHYCRQNGCNHLQIQMIWVEKPCGEEEPDQYDDY